MLWDKLIKAEGEEVEIEVIYRKYFRDVFFYVRAISGNESLAEEITQETFVKAMKNIEQFDERKEIRAWLFTIAKNTYFRHCRRNKIFLKDDILDEMSDSAPQILEKMIEQEMVYQIQKNIECLSETYREVLCLRIYGELSFEEIGKCCKKSAGWARVTYHRARKMIQSKIKQEDMQDERNRL